MRKMQTLSHYEEEYFNKHPEEIVDYLEIIFDEYSNSVSSLPSRAYSSSVYAHYFTSNTFQENQLNLQRYLVLR